MKKLLTLLLALTLVITLFACSDTSTGDNENEAENKSENQDVSVGDIVKFGAYEQDNNIDNGKEEIEWLVLDVKGGKALLISKYCLDTKRYNTEVVDITWEDCTLRAWLNNEFLNEAFDASELSAIVESTIQNPDNEEYDTDGGNDTKDKIFLLSIDEAYKYFADDEARASAPTEYNKHDSSVWWLRSPGYYQSCAACVDYDGGVICDGTHVRDGDIVIRPALWVDLDSNDVDITPVVPDEQEEPENVITEPVPDKENEQKQEQNTYTGALLGNASVGEIVKFGSYEQDNNIDNGKEEIEWQVLEVRDGKALIISKYCLDEKPYNTEEIDITWEDCTLRAWLNNEFLNEAFNSSERSAIVESTIQNPDNEYYGTEGGSDTKDKIFLLSIDEARKYFADDEARMAYSTEYAKANGVYVYYDRYETSYWWLRSPGGNQHFAAGVHVVGCVSGSGGNVIGFGIGVSSSCIAVRPALWVTLDN